MQTLIRYAKRRHFSMSRGWGRPWCRWLWLDAAAFAVARYYTLISPSFRFWCEEVDRLFYEQHDWPASYTDGTGLDCWIDAYWKGWSPQDAVISEVEHWDC